jgi:hypothetical protein
VRRSFITACLLFFFAAVSFADDLFSVSGSLKLQGIMPLESDSETEVPGLIGRVKIDTTPPAWHFYTWIEGGWDGSVDLDSRDHAVLKTYDAVYQRNAVFLDFKECYGAYIADFFELRAGIQRFAWGRLDEYPINDLLNPWDYTQFLSTPLEDRKIGAPSLSTALNLDNWRFQAVWIPWLVSYRLSLPSERWSGFPGATALTKIPGLEVIPHEPDLPSCELENSSVGFRFQHLGSVEWAVNLFHGYDPRPVFKTTQLTVRSFPQKLLIDPGYEPDFHKMSSIGMDAAGIQGDLSLRAEAAYALGRYFNTRWERWGYPTSLLRSTYTLNPNEHQSDTLEYGIGFDYRLYEDCLLTLQVQQRVIIDRPETLFERQLETLAWAAVKTGWMNQKVETNLSMAFNPEHGGLFAKANARYVFTDYWKAGITAVMFDGNSQSLFGRFARNDQLEAEIDFFW